LVSRLNKIFLWFLITGLQAQPDQLNTDVLNLQLLSNEDFAALESLLDNPLSLNTATAADLWFLEDSLVVIVLTARQAGPFTGWEDVARRTHLPPARIEALRQFVYLAPERALQGRLSTRITTSGTDERIRTRLNLDGDQWKAQWVVQRDPGEYHLADLSDLSVMMERGSTSFALGAHRVTWGLGVVLADEFATPRGETLLRPASGSIRLRPGYSNTNTGVLRGASIHCRQGRVQLIAGTSIQQADVTTDPQGNPRVVAYRAHTRPTATAGETLAYFAGTVSVLGWNLGGLTTWYDLQATAETAGSRRQVHSLVAARTFQSRLGEWHASHEEGLQTTARASQTRLSFERSSSPQHSRLRLTLLHRRYPQGWVPLRGHLVGARVSRGNESGWFFGWLWGHTPWKISGYLDTYRQQVPDQTGSWPRVGWESGLAASVKKHAVKVSLYYRSREETANASVLSSAGLDLLEQRLTTSHYVRFSLLYSRSPAFTARFVAAATTSDAGGQEGKGETFGGSLRYRFRSGAAVTLGAHVFETDDWDHRLYVYEDGLPGEFSLRALSGQGVRMHGRVALPVGKGQVSLRVARQWRRTSPEESALQVGLQMDIAL